MRRLWIIGVPALVLAMGAPWQSAPAAATVTFTKDVAPILDAKCVACHRPGEVAPMALQTFAETRPFARAIRDKVVSRQMPPWFADRSAGTFSNDPSLTEKEIATISAWVDAGAPEGNAADMPTPPSFTDGWQLGEPDYIAELPEVHIPATGGDYFPTPTLTLDIKEDHWVRAIEIRPGNREVTHHSVIFATPNPLSLLMGGASGGTGLFDVLAVWAVGTEPTVFADGTGRWIRKGEMLRTNLHYHPNGTPQVDRTRVGFYFGKGELKKEVAAGLAGNTNIMLAPGESREFRGVYAVDQDIDIVSLFPHMHLRGKDMKMTAVFPGGQEQTLINIPAYDFSWQLFYYPTKSIRLPKGTRLDLVAHYDNSAANKLNPDPTRTVRFGESSNDEMMFGMFEFTAASGTSPKPSSEASRAAALVESFPAGTAFMVRPEAGSRAQSLVLHIPRSGDGEWYLPSQLGFFTPTPVQDLKWDGPRFSFASRVTAAGAPRAPRGMYDVTGTVEADGTIRGHLAARNGQAAYDFAGTAKP